MRHAVRCAAVCLAITGAAATPATMRAVQVKGRCSKDDFSTCMGVGTIATPQPRDAGQVLVRMNSSSVNPYDIDVALLAGGGKATPGTDFAGVVAAVAAPGPLQVGDRVWGMTAAATRGTTGAWAEYAVVDVDGAGVVPQALPLSEAGTVPMAGLTSFFAFGKAGAPWAPSSNTTVVIVAGSGGTGYMAVQLAKLRGAARVVTAATGADTIAFVKGLGADVVVDYKTDGEALDAVPDNSVDVVYDNIGVAGAGALAARKLRAGGTLVCIASQCSAPGARAGVKAVLYSLGGQSQTAQGRAENKVGLDTLAGLVSAGQLRVAVQSTFPLDRVADAIAADRAGAVSKVAVSAAAPVGPAPAPPAPPAPAPPPLPACVAELEKDCAAEQGNSAACAGCVVRNQAALRSAGCNIKLGTHDDSWSWCHGN